MMMMMAVVVAVVVAIGEKEEKADELQEIEEDGDCAVEAISEQGARDGKEGDLVLSAADHPRKQFHHQRYAGNEAVLLRDAEFEAEFAVVVPAEAVPGLEERRRRGEIFFSDLLFPIVSSRLVLQALDPALEGLRYVRRLEFWSGWTFFYGAWTCRSK